MAKPNILCDTAGMTRERWLECRMHGPKGDIPYTIGGSDVAAVFGLSPWTTPLELWLIKKGRMKPPMKDNPDQLEMGHLLEPITAHFYAKKTGHQVLVDTNMYQHADFPYALADIDRKIIRKDNGEEGVLECKSCTYHKADSWANDAYPIYYEMQLRFYLAVKDLNFGAFSAMWGNNPDNDMAFPELERDKAKEDMIFDKLDRFIWSLVHDKPPTMEDVSSKLALESLARIYKSNSGLPTIEFSDKFERPLRRIAEIQRTVSDKQSEIKILEEEAEKHSVRIAEIMKEHEHGVLETTKDKILIDFVTKTTKRADTKTLKEKYPTVYTDVLKVSESRKLKVSVQTT